MLSISGEAPAEVFAGVKISENVEAPRLDLLAPPRRRSRLSQRTAYTHGRPDSFRGAVPTAPASLSRRGCRVRTGPAGIPVSVLTFLIKKL
jgi:hypothetical protein